MKNCIIRTFRGFENGKVRVRNVVDWGILNCDLQVKVSEKGGFWT